MAENPSAATNDRGERARATLAALSMTILRLRWLNCPIPLANDGSGLCFWEDEIGAEMNSTARSRAFAYGLKSPVAWRTHASQHCSSASRNSRRAHQQIGFHQ